MISQMWKFILVFAIVLLFYIHIQFHWKTSNDIDVAHIEVPQKDTLETIADLRQPFIFNQNTESNLLITPRTDSVLMIKDGKEVEVPHKAMLSTLKTEPYLAYLRENDGVFNSDLKNLNIYLRPFMTCSTHHDILFGSKSVTTSLQHKLNYRNYLYVLDGDIEIKLVPPKYSNLLDGDNKYQSKIDIWNQDLTKHIETILIPLKKGDLIFIPAYWWYSIKFNEDDPGCIATFSYRTFMNTLAIAPQLAIGFLQENNVNYKIEVKK